MTNRLREYLFRQQIKKYYIHAVKSGYTELDFTKGLWQFWCHNRFVHAKHNNKPTWIFKF
jgi:hypothetical protein